MRSLHFEAESRDDDPFEIDGRGPAGRLLCTGGADGVVKCYTMQPNADGTLKPRPPAQSESKKPTARHRGDRHAPPPDAVSAVYRERRCGAHTLKGHGGAIVAVQADDTKVVSASIDGTVRCWDLKTGDQLFALEGHSRHINSLHFQGDLLVADGTQGTVIVHDFSGR